MADLGNKLIDICNEIWIFRRSPGIWRDSESEPETEENLIYKRLDGLRTLVLPLTSKLIDLKNLRIDKNDFFVEINTLVSSLNSKEHFFPAPYAYIPVPQPDDYIDMLSHSLLFAIQAYNLDYTDIKKSSLKALIERCVKTLTTEGNFFHDSENSEACWAGTTIFESGLENIEVKSTYFTSQVVISLSAWIIWAKNQTFKNKQDEIKRIEILLSEACRWILKQNDGKKILMISGDDDKIPQINEIVTINSTALTACFLCNSILGEGEKNKTIEMTEKFIDLLFDRKKEIIYADWYHQVATKVIGPQYYVDRQENFGILSFLGLASKHMKDKWKGKIEEIADFLISEYIDNIIIKDEYIGCLPWFIEDLITSDLIFNVSTEKIEISKRKIKEAISKTLMENSIIDFIGNSVIKNITDLINQDRYDTISKAKKIRIPRKKQKNNKV